MKIRFTAEYEDDQIIYNHCIKTEQTQQDYRFHYHDAYELLLLKEGGISYQTGGETCRLRKNSLVFTRPHQSHCIRVDEDIPYDRHDLLFSGSCVSQDILAKIPDSLNVISFEGNRLAVQLFDKLEFYCEKLSGEALHRIFRSITEEILLNILIYLEEQQDDPTRARHPLTMQAVAYIEENLLSIQQVDQICRHLSVSKSYLYQLFMKDLNTTPKHYITLRRLALARKELFLGAKATSVYAACGFTDYSAFFRAYKKHFGYSPTATQQSTAARVTYEDVLRAHPG